VHLGATKQNITQTGDMRVVREAHRRILRLLAGVLVAAAHLAERTADMLAAGRTVNTPSLIPSDSSRPGGSTSSAGTSPGCAGVGRSRPGVRRLVRRTARIPANRRAQGCCAATSNFPHARAGSKYRSGGGLASRMACRAGKPDEP